MLSFSVRSRSFRIFVNILVWFKIVIMPKIVGNVIMPLEQPTFKFNSSLPDGIDSFCHGMDSVIAYLSNEFQ